MRAVFPEKTLSCIQNQLDTVCQFEYSQYPYQGFLGIDAKLIPGRTDTVN